MADQNGDGAQTPPVAPGAQGQSGAAAPPAGQGASLATGGDAGTAGGDAGGSGKPADGSAGDGASKGEGEAGKAGDGKAGDAKADGAPEAYDFTSVQMPDGITLDAGLVDKVTPVLRELNLTNDQASKLTTAYAEHRAAEAAAAETAFAEQVEGWAKQAREDKEFGGTAFDENVKSAQKAVAAFATPELRTLLDSTGLGNHPELLRFCARIGKAIGEDTHHKPAGAGGGSRDLKDRMYPNMVK